jgi:hypothetical protein
MHIYRRKAPGLNVNWYEVENTNKNLAYDAPNYLANLAEWDLIRVIEHKDEESLQNDLKSRNVTLREGEPSQIDLLP